MKAGADEGAAARRERAARRESGYSEGERLLGGRAAARRESGCSEGAAARRERLLGGSVERTRGEGWASLGGRSPGCVVGGHAGLSGLLGSLVRIRRRGERHRERGAAPGRPLRSGDYGGRRDGDVQGDGGLRPGGGRDGSCKGDVPISILALDGSIRIDIHSVVYDVEVEVSPNVELGRETWAYSEEGLSDFQPNGDGCPPTCQGWAGWMSVSTGA